MAKKPNRNAPVGTDLDTPGSDERPTQKGGHDTRYGSTEDIYAKIERAAKTYRK